MKTMIKSFKLKELSPIEKSSILGGTINSDRNGGRDHKFNAVTSEWRDEKQMK